MKVTVYSGSNFGSEAAFRDAAYQLGQWIGQNKHTLVYGGACVGLMGILADTVLTQGGQVIGVMPTFLATRERVHQSLTEFIQVETMGQRKAKMIALGDIFVALPGGPGTLEEISEIMSLIRLEKVQGPCYFINTNGYYDALAQFVDQMVTSQFLEPEVRAQFIFIKEAQEIVTDK